MGKQRRQSNRGKPNRGSSSGGRGSVMRGTQPNRGGGGRNRVSLWDNLGTARNQRAMQIDSGDVGGPIKFPMGEFDQSATHRAGVAAGGLSAGEIMRLSDEERYLIPMAALPDAPAGQTWAEDRTLVDKSFYR